MLAAHPEVAGVLESWLIPLGFAPLFSRHHWNPESRSAAREIVGPDRPLPGLGQLVTREQLVADVGALSRRWMATAVEPRHRFLVEKTPWHLRAHSVLAELFPRARFVHVVRDGRDAAVSLRAAAQSWNPGWGESTEGRSIRDAAVSWRVAMHDGWAARDALGDRYLEVRYESLHADPQGAIRRLYGFCGIPYDDGLVDEVWRATDFASNFAGGEDRFRRAGRTGDWKTRLSWPQRLNFARQAGPELVACGYASSRFGWALRPAPLRAGAVRPRAR